MEERSRIIINIEDKQFNNVVKFLEEHRLGRNLTEDEKLIAKKVYYLGRQHQFDAMIDSVKEVY